MGEYVTIRDVNEAIWRNHYQIVTADEDDVDCINPRFFGSAFSLIYRNRRWIVTADHVIHPEKHNIAEVPEGVDLSKIEHRYFLINNVNAKQKLETILTSLFGFYFYDKFNKEMLDFTKEELEELGATADDFFTRIDVAFADISKGLPCQPLTHALLDNNNISVVVAHGLEKLSLLEESIAEPSKDKIYYDFGVVKNDIVGIRFVRYNAAYGGIRFVEERDGLYIFESPTDIKYDEWAALSGSAMFDEDGNIVGMTIRVNPDNRNIIVVPMKIILRLMDYAIAHES